MSLDMNLYSAQMQPIVDEIGIRKFIDTETIEALGALVYSCAEDTLENALENDDLGGFEDRFTQEIERIIWALEIVKNEGIEYLTIKPYPDLANK